MDNWVRIMFDYCSSGLWDWDGTNMDKSEVPISDELKARITVWLKVFDEHSWEMQSLEGYDGDRLLTLEEETRYKELEELCLEDFRESVRIAVEVKKQIPEWTVKVFNHSNGILMLPQDERRNSEILLGWVPVFDGNLIT